jgi:hypothetical protein
VPKSSFLSSLLFSVMVLMLLLSSSSLALGSSINNLSDMDSAFTLFGVDSAGNVFVLSPGATLHLDRGMLDFASSVPPGWTRGDVTFTLSFNNQMFAGSTSVFNGSFCHPTSACFFFSFNGIAISQRYPATLTLTFGGTNGGTSTAKFVVAPVAEPGTVLLFGTGSAFLFVLVYRHRRRIAEASLAFAGSRPLES